jgi:DNA repair photolyase
VLNPPESTGMPYWSVNPYVGCAFGCAYCYARYAHRYVSERNALSRWDDNLPNEGGEAAADDEVPLPPWLAFERRIFVKPNAGALIRAGFASGSSRRRLARGECLVIGTATDPYQPAERQFRITRGVLEALADQAGLRIVVITKSPLITRDRDLLQVLARRSRLTVHLSLITLDRDLARRLEPRAPTPEARLRVLERLRAADIDVGINLMPVLPGITDTRADLASLIARVAALGATHVNTGALRLQSEARRHYLPFIDRAFPHLSPAYHAAYARAPHAAPRYRDGLTRTVRSLCATYGIRYGSSLEERMPMPDDAQLALAITP